MQIVKKLSKLSDLNPIYINMLISYGTATVCCIYLILKVIGVAGYQVGIFPDTYRYLQAQKQQRQVLLVHMVKKSRWNWHYWQILSPYTSKCIFLWIDNPLTLVISIIGMADNEVGTFLPTYMEFDKQKQKRQGFICQVQMVKRWFRPARSEPNIHLHPLLSLDLSQVVSGSVCASSWACLL